MKNHQPLGCQYKVDRNADENSRRASGGKSGVIHLESLRSVLLAGILPRSQIKPQHQDVKPMSLMHFPFHSQ